MLERLKRHLDVDPFVPFRLVATSGSTYEVLSPYQIAIGETQLEYFYPKSDRSATIRLNQLVAFETLDVSKS